MRSVVVLAFLALAVPACAERIPHHFIDEGRLCVYPAGVVGDPRSTVDESYAYAAGAPLEVAVALPACVGNSCTSDPRASCTVAGSSGDLQVTSEGSYVEIVRDSCTLSGCEPFAARCTTPVLPAGDHVVHHGADTLVLTLPAAGPPPCTGQLQGL